MEAKVQVHLEEDHCRAFRYLWKISVPTRIKTFGWRIFFGQISHERLIEKRDLFILIHKEVVFFAFIQMNI